MSNRSVVVLGRNYTSRLSMIRAAGMAGYRVTVINTDKKQDPNKVNKAIDSFSQYVDRYYCVREPNTEKLIDLLLGEVKEDDYRMVLLPTDDYTASVIDSHADILSYHYLFSNIDNKQGQIIHFMDKSVQKTIAKQCGLNVAQGSTATCENGQYVISAEITYPCFIKPEVSFRGNKHFMQKCDNPEQLNEALRDLAKTLSSPVLIEQFIDIKKEYAMLGFVANETVLMPAVIAIDSMYLGVAASATVSPMKNYPELERKLSRYISELGLVGLFDIDLYEDEKGTIFFNELNLRFGASGYAITKKIINLPQKLIEALYADGNEEQEGVNDFQPFSFASEKVCFQRYLSGKTTWREYQKTIREADCLFVEDKDDPRPGYQLKKAVCRKHIIRELKKIIRR